MSQLIPSNIMERNTYLKTNIKATAKQIYKAWLSTQGHTKMTGGSSEKVEINLLLGEVILRVRT